MSSSGFQRRTLCLPKWTGVGHHTEFHNFDWTLLLSSAQVRSENFLRSLSLRNMVVSTRTQLLDKVVGPEKETSKGPRKTPETTVKRLGAATRLIAESKSVSFSKDTTQTDFQKNGQVERTEGSTSPYHQNQESQMLIQGSEFFKLTEVLANMCISAPETWELHESSITYVIVSLPSPSRCSSMDVLKGGGGGGKKTKKTKKRKRRKRKKRNKTNAFAQESCFSVGSG
ncbi:uncharacterized protein LOC104871347 [Fukomys damarensis]|uniref:uncharacterized protein LOC104871347 n=1 Tax=Fukomys damarensis TaxID=885580 RepID=UPI00053F6327|nr:uncharacterized protein LOC104871347 [Fukomys damarensis]